VFVHAGDLCLNGDLDELKSAVAWIEGLPHRHKIVIGGNHDWALVEEPAAARALLAGVTYLEDAAATVAGLGWYGSPWQPEFGGWAFNLRRGPEIDAVWARIPAGLDVLVTHGPPAGLGDLTITGTRAGCADLLRRVQAQAPRLHLYGHIHEDGGVWREGATTFVNVTVAAGDRAPTVIDLEPGAEAPVVIAPPASGW
jgi:predicted phosphodiesterase